MMSGPDVLKSAVEIVKAYASANQANGETLVKVLEQVHTKLVELNEKD
jgi:predicted transcriptional regulator